MRIGYVISRYPGVSHTFIQREVLGLRKLGWSVSTISIRRTPAKELLTETDRAEAAHTHVVVPPGIFNFIAALFGAMLRTPARFVGALSCAWSLRRPGLRGALWAFFYFLEALIVHRICRREKIRHLHAHFANVSTDVAMIASVLNRGTFSYTMHGPTEFFDIAEHRLERKTRAAKFIVCISDFARSQLMSLIPSDQWSKLHVVHCGVDPEQFRPATILRKQRTTHRSLHRANILCVARLSPVKGHAILLQALSELTLRDYDVTLTFAGDGPLRDELTRLAEVLGLQSRVHFLGNVGQDVIHEHFAAADMFVLPSFAEGVPVVLMEAMASHCPVIATRIAGIPELIEHGVSGLLVPAGRADLLADAIERNMLNPRAAERMALVGEEKVRRDFNLNTVAPHLASIFRNILEPRTATAVDVRTRAVEKASETSPRRDAREVLTTRQEVPR